MIKVYLSLVYCLLFSSLVFSQVQRDLDKSVPLWLEYDNGNNATLHWIKDGNAADYVINTSDDNFNSLTQVDNADGTSSSYDLGTLDSDTHYHYQLTKDNNGKGLITIGLEMAPVHKRGRCLIAIDEILTQPLQSEIVRLMQDMTMDGWDVDTASIERRFDAIAVRSFFQNWYETGYEGSQTIFILGHVPIPYSGNSAYDGHNDHQGAWVADSYYGDVDGNWTDVAINNVTPRRDANDNVPGDGKFDQSLLPSPIEIEVGRADFHNLPVFDLDEIELARQYLDKNHRFRRGEIEYPRRAFVDNNFAGFEEGFGQTGWKNFPTLFGADSVSIKDYDVLIDNKYLCSYACGAGSYTSCGGVGTTANVWAGRDNQTVFTFTFGSYFGDWDVADNFLRSALASGDVLTNAWAGRPSWHIFPMALGKHIGYCARLTQNASDQVFGQGFAARTAHVSLLGDPTLRLHAMKPASGLDVKYVNGNAELEWKPSPDADNGYILYKKTEDTDWEVVEEFYNDNSYMDSCLAPDTRYSYMVKAVRLEHTASGTYYNTSLGIMQDIEVMDNPFIHSFFVDVDGDGYGDAAQSINDCAPPPGYVDNDFDCDDTNPNVNPDQTEMPYNGVDDDCNAATLDDDLDQDGFLQEDDCDDDNPDINPDQTEIPYNGIDEDCNSATLDDDLDQDGFFIEDDCDDMNAMIYPGAEEIPDNGIDEDCDGMDLVTSDVAEIESNKVSLSPNPVGDILFVDTELIVTHYSVINLQGQLIRTGVFGNRQIDVSELNDGMYLLELKITNQSENLIKRFFKK